MSQTWDEIMVADCESERRTDALESLRTAREEWFMRNAAAGMKYVYLEELDLQDTADIERVARAICVADGYNPDADKYIYRDSPYWLAYNEQAKAAIKAMNKNATGDFIKALIHYAAKKDYKSLDELIREKITNEPVG